MLTGPQIAAFAANVARVAYLVELSLDSGTLYLATASVDVKFGGRTWVGLGMLADVSPISESTDLAATGLRLTLSGVPLALRSIAATEPVRNRKCIVRTVIYNQNWQAIDGAIDEFAGRMDAPQLSTSGADAGGNRTAVITINVEQDMMDHARGGRYRRHTHEDQQELYPGDDFYLGADEISLQSVKWGSN